MGKLPYAVYRLGALGVGKNKFHSGIAIPMGNDRQDSKLWQAGAKVAPEEMAMPKEMITE